MENQGAQGPSAQQGENSSPAGPSSAGPSSAASTDRDIEATVRTIVELFPACPGLQEDVFNAANRRLKIKNLETKAFLVNAKLEESRREAKEAAAADAAEIPPPQPNGPVPTGPTGVQVQQPPGPPLEPARQSAARSIAPSLEPARQGAARSVAPSEPSSERKTERSRFQKKRSRRRAKVV